MNNTLLTDMYLQSAVLNDLPRVEEVAVGGQAAEIIDRYLEISAAFPDTEDEGLESRREDLLRELGRIGFFGLTIPKAYGGMGLSLRQYLAIVERTMSSGMATVFTALAHLSIGIKGIVLFGSEKQREKYLIPAATGDMIFSYALTEPNTGSDARNIQTTATLSADGHHYILKGTKTYITNANLAGAMTVFAQMDPDNPGWMGAFIVETAWKGVRIGKEMPKMGLKASSTASVQLNNVKVPIENLLGRPGDGFKIAMTILNYGRLALGAGSAGMMKQSLRDMRDRAMRRNQFGMPIGDFELIQEKLVKAKVNGSVASAITEYTAAALEIDPTAQVAVESSHCKLFGTTRAWETLYDALQVAGGAGFLSTHPYEKRMRDFRVTTIFEGTTEIHSIYPALFILRQLTKQMKSEASGSFSRIWFFLKRLLLPPRWKFRFRQTVMDRAKRFAWFSAILLRWMLLVGLLLYGRKIYEKQFYLRRITHLSLDLFATLAMLSRIDSARQKGLVVADDLNLLDYFVSAAKNARSTDRFRRGLRHERIHAKVAAGLGNLRSGELTKRRKHGAARPSLPPGGHRPQRA